jgi:hypothetical protein
VNIHGSSRIQATLKSAVLNGCANAATLETRYNLSRKQNDGSRKDSKVQKLEKGFDGMSQQVVASETGSTIRPSSVNKRALSP